MVGRLTAAKVKALGEGRHSDGGGLLLSVRGGSRTWHYRFQKNGKRREMSLGPFPAVSLSEARVLRDEAAALRRKGVDPLERKANSGGRTVAMMIDETFDTIKRDLKGEGKAGRWMDPVNALVIPKLGHRDITELTPVDIRDAFSPVWQSKAAYSEKAFQRLGMAMRRAAAAFPGDIDPDIMRHARTLLGSQRREVRHIPAMPWQEVPGFYASLGANLGDLALKLVILTAARSGSVRLARQEQFRGDVWTIPAENMKTGQEFRVPLSPDAQAVVEHARPMARDGWLFAPRGKPISNMTLAASMKRRGLPYRPHGFRASFRSWCEETGEEWVLAETALSHNIGTRVQRAYQRSDLLEQRRPLMEKWARCVTTSTCGS